MKIRAKTSLSLLASAILLCANSSAFAEKHGNQHLNPGWGFFGGNATDTNLSASLAGATGYLGTGYINYFSNAKGGSLSAHIQLPVDGTVITTSGAATSTYTLTVLNGSSTVATCVLDVTNINFSYSSADSTVTTPTEFVEYDLSIHENGSNLTSKIGGCSASGVAITTLPALASGDTISVALTGSSSSAVLTGSFGATLIHSK